MTLLELFALLKKHLKLVIALPIACALATAVFSWAFLPNTYTSTVSMYVLTRANENTSVLTSTDLTASQMLTNDVATLIKSDRIESDTASKLQMDSLKGYDVKVSSESCSLGSRWAFAACLNAFTSASAKPMDARVLILSSALTACLS